MAEKNSANGKKKRRTNNQQVWKGKKPKNKSMIKYSTAELLAMFVPEEDPRFFPAETRMNTEVFTTECQAPLLMSQTITAPENLPEWFMEPAEHSGQVPLMQSTVLTEVQESTQKQEQSKQKLTVQLQFGKVKNMPSHLTQYTKLEIDEDWEVGFSKIDSEYEEKCKVQEEFLDFIDQRNTNDEVAEEEEEMPQWDEAGPVQAEGWGLSLPQENAKIASTTKQEVSEQENVEETPQFPLSTLNKELNEGNPFATILKLAGKVENEILYILPTSKAYEPYWYYKDPCGNIQGPFNSIQMYIWSICGYFDTKLQVSCGQKWKFVPLSYFQELEKERYKKETRELQKYFEKMDEQYSRKPSAGQTELSKDNAAEEESPDNNQGDLHASDDLKTMLRIGAQEYSLH